MIVQAQLSPLVTVEIRGVRPNEMDMLKKVLRFARAWNWDQTCPIIPNASGAPVISQRQLPSTTLRAELRSRTFDTVYGRAKYGKVYAYRNRVQKRLVAAERNTSQPYYTVVDYTALDVWSVLVHELRHAWQRRTGFFWSRSPVKDVKERFKAARCSKWSQKYFTTPCELDAYQQEAIWMRDVEDFSRARKICSFFFEEYMRAGIDIFAYQI